VATFQIIFIPVLILALTLTSLNVEWGILFFVFVFPLINNLPYFFGIYGHIPHAPTALVLFLAFFLGWLINHIYSSKKAKFDHPVFKPLILFSFLIIFSGVITFLRYANFFPFLSDKIYDLSVNVNHVSAGGAIMSDVFNLLNYLTGFAFFFVLFNTLKSKIFLKRILIVLSVSVLLCLLFALVQKYYSQSLGNTPLWVNKNRINATFKDPNSFGVFLSACIPVLLGMVFSFQKRFAKVFFIFLGLFALFVFPFIGSRSGFIGLIIAGVVFFLLIISKLKISLKKKIVYLTLFCLVLSLVFFSFFIFFQHSNLFKRIEWSVEVVSKRDTFEDVFTKKLFFWDAALDMVGDYPVTGIGLGGFIIELPNYLKRMDIPYRFTDSAENYYIQVISEMGLIGIMLILWLFAVILKQIAKNIKEFPSHSSDRFILYGATAGIVSVLINYLVHSYVGSFEAKYFFWLLVAITFVFAPE
jgi:O-antigen ligase